MLSLRLRASIGVCAAALLTAQPAFARITWDLKPTGTNNYDWTLRQHWHYNRTGASAGYGSCYGNCNYHSLGADNDPDVSWGGPGNAAPECLEVTTYPGQYTSNPDSVIDVLDSNTGTWLLISDDFGGTYQSHARIWIEAPVTTLSAHLRVRPYGYYSNSDEFYVTITRRDLTKSQCTSGQTSIPWVQITNSPSLTFTLSSFH
jgi:hypothetical protein